MRLISISSVGSATYAASDSAVATSAPPAPTRIAVAAIAGSDSILLPRHSSAAAIKVGMGQYRAGIVQMMVLVGILPLAV